MTSLEAQVPASFAAHRDEIEDAEQLGWKLRVSDGGDFVAERQVFGDRPGVRRLYGSDLGELLERVSRLGVPDRWQRAALARSAAPVRAEMLSDPARELLALLPDLDESKIAYVREACAKLSPSVVDGIRELAVSDHVRDRTSYILAALRHALDAGPGTFSDGSVQESFETRMRRAAVESRAALGMRDLEPGGRVGPDRRWPPEEERYVHT
jgi:hypothetical protein